MSALNLFYELRFLFFLIPLISLRRNREDVYTQMSDETLMMGNVLMERRTIYSQRFGISGTPDRIIGTIDSVIPMMFREMPASDGPKMSHMIQMGVYFLILPELYPGMYVRYGVLTYTDSKYRVANSLTLKNAVLSRLDEMSRTSGLPTRNHDDPARCMNCPYSSGCMQRLID